MKERTKLIGKTHNRQYHNMQMDYIDDRNADH